jgi:hypothetical protein
MDAKFILNDKEVPISWENELGIGTILYVSAPTLIYACAAVQFLLKQMGYHHLWYSNEVIVKAGVFQYKIVEVKEAEAYNCN